MIKITPTISNLIFSLCMLFVFFIAYSIYDMYRFNGDFVIEDISKDYSFMLYSKNHNTSTVGTVSSITYSVEGEISDTIRTGFGYFLPGKVNETNTSDWYSDTMKIIYHPHKEGLKGFLRVKYRF